VRFDRVDLVVSFVMLSGLDLVGDGLDDAIARGAQVRVLTTDYLGITEPAALDWLLERTQPELQPAPLGSLAAKVFSDQPISFHPKAYLFCNSATGEGVGFVGSSNLSCSGLHGGIGWNVRTSEVPLLRFGFECLWDDPRSVDPIRTCRCPWVSRTADEARQDVASYGNRGGHLWRKARSPRRVGSPICSTTASPCACSTAQRTRGDVPR
jgi:hypothetical protein